ncbi:MAG: Gfo/Idh/MocA family oxidoreductase [Caldilineaceae bacterium]
MINIGVIGYGYWGPNLVRNFTDTPEGQVTAVSDLSTARLASAQQRHPSVRVTTDFHELVNAPDIDAIIIATPVSTHFDLALQALQAGKHVFVEKPLAASAEQASRLIDEAARRQRTLMVDHTFVYTGAVRKMQELITGNALGDIYYYDSVRINLGLFQHDVNVIWDLAVHDLSIMDYLLRAQPCAVSATGMSHVAGKPENIAYLTLFFESNLIAHIHINWLAPVKVRRTLIGGSQKMIVYDDIEPSEKVKVYDKGITVNGSTTNGHHSNGHQRNGLLLNGQGANGHGHNGRNGSTPTLARPSLARPSPDTDSENGEGDNSKYQMLVGYRTGDMWAPQLNMSEALSTEAAHFIDCIQSGKPPITDGEAGLRIVRILEKATESMAAQGRPIALTTERSAI